MFRPEVSMRPATPTANAQPLQPATMRGTGFAALVGEVQADVRNSIENGFSTSAWSSLSVEGQAMRERLQNTSAVVGGATASSSAEIEGQQAFFSSIAPLAREAGQRLGVAPELVAAHAALESGWGRRTLRQTDGKDTNNLFGIKAGAGWNGDVAQVLTTEYEGGAAVKKSEVFRSYPDQAAAFKDYAQLLQNNPRYRAALNTGSDARAFAQGLARGGYATDPSYADKLSRVASRLRPGG